MTVKSISAPKRTQIVSQHPHEVAHNHPGLQHQEISCPPLGPKGFKHINSTQKYMHIVASPHPKKASKFNSGSRLRFDADAQHREVSVSDKCQYTFNK